MTGTCSMKACALKEPSVNALKHCFRATCRPCFVTSLWFITAYYLISRLSCRRYCKSGVMWNGARKAVATFRAATTALEDRHSFNFLYHHAVHPPLMPTGGALYNALFAGYSQPVEVPSRFVLIGAVTNTPGLRFELVFKIAV